MKKLGLMVCTNSAIDYIDHNIDVRVVRSTILLGDKEYVDYEELTADKFYDKLEEDSSLFPRTSMASTGKMLEFYETLRDEGCDTILFVTISSGMSGIYDNAMMAAKMVEGVDVHVFNSKSVGYIECKMIFEAYKAYQEGKSIDEIIKDLEYIRDNNHIYFAVNDLRYLVKNGRLTNAQAFMANILKIKPLLEINNEGKVVSIEKIRTFKKAVNRVIEKFLEETENTDVEPFIIHANNPETAQYVREQVLEVRPEYKEIKDYLLTPAVGAHSGPGAITIGYIKTRK
ncbi:DegV family protein [Hujiaoplasma nucleasis]|uniref:DegV family protein n=1 Tax=Hujiaoplasma nucleasis TaxID=2725268 RepID=A0A7L6N541_9MOLU|nr:DegV family protein [Hujiaoplasma nucleasis]QLY40115.1 DegV family protein [Hujiaoplasma nucleasis]